MNSTTAITSIMPIVIDGSRGEGGGHILRSALSLSAITRQPFVLENIRAGRKKPGLMRQHLTCVLAAAAMCDAELHGAQLSSTTLRFWPRKGPVPSAHRSSIGTAGSTSLVLQTVLPIALAADGRVTVDVEGGTHVPFAPVTDFLQQCFAPSLHEMGASLVIERSRAGFYPAGGGAVKLVVDGAGPERLRRFERRARGAIARVDVVGLATSTSVAGASLAVHTIKRLLSDDVALVGVEVHEVIDEVRAPGPGQCLWVRVACARAVELFSAIPERGESPKDVAHRLVAEVRAWLQADVPVGEHLADQLLLPLALGHGGAFVTSEPTEHSRTNAAVIQQFLPDVTVVFEQTGPQQWLTTVLTGA